LFNKIFFVPNFLITEFAFAVPYKRASLTDFPWIIAEVKPEPNASPAPVTSNLFMLKVVVK